MHSVSARRRCAECVKEGSASAAIGGPLSDRRGDLSLGSFHVFRSRRRNYEIWGHENHEGRHQAFRRHKADCSKCFVGTALAKFDLDPSSTAPLIIRSTFIMSVIMAAYVVHTISINSTRRHIRSSLCAIVFVLATLILAFLSHVRGYDVISGFIGIDGRRGIFIIVTIFVWLLTSLVGRCTCTP